MKTECQVLSTTVMPRSELDRCQSTTPEARFIELFQRGMDCWVAAGQLLLEQERADPEFTEKLLAANPQLDHNILRIFRDLGRKLIHPMFAAGHQPAISFARRLPYAIQDELANGRNGHPKTVSLLLANGEVLLASIYNLTLSQAKQVFSRQNIRSVEEQRLWLEEKKTMIELKRAQVEEPYRLVKDSLIVMKAGTKFTKRDLVRILARLED